ncbi:response regulator [Streptomyces erythrochromogenes]
MDTARLVLSYVKAFVWPAVVLYVLLRYRKEIGDVIRRLKGLQTAAVSFEFAEEARTLLDQASAATKTPVPASVRHGVLRRLEHAKDLLQGGKVLWVDDHPKGNASLVQLFQSIGMDVDEAISTDEALGLLQRHSYDLILSDIGRGDDGQAGIRMMEDLDRLGIDTPVVIYTMGFDYERGFPRRAFAVTEVPDEVVHYVIDLMERVRLG